MSADPPGGGRQASWSAEARCAGDVPPPRRDCNLARFFAVPGQMPSPRAPFSPRAPCSGERGSAAVKDVVAEILHFQDRDIGPPFDRLRQMRLGDLANHAVI